MKKAIHTILALAAAAVLWTGCDDKIGTPPDLGRAISFICDETETRAQEATAGNMTTFRVWAGWRKSAGEYIGDYMNGQLVEKKGGAWVYSPVLYMPAYGSVDFFAYSPADATVKVSNDRTHLDYEVTTDPASQHDFIIAEAPGKTTTPVALNFQHTLSSVSVEIKNNHPDYSYRIRAVKLINLHRKGTLTRESSGWSWKNQSDKTTYTFNQNGYIDIASGEQKRISDIADPLMILLQTVERGVSTNDPDQLTSGAYVAVTYNLYDSQGDDVLGLSLTNYIPLGDPINGFTFEMNGKYTLSIDLRP